MKMCVLWSKISLSLSVYYKLWPAKLADVRCCENFRQFGKIQNCSATSVLRCYYIIDLLHEYILLLTRIYKLCFDRLYISCVKNHM